MLSLWTSSPFVKPEFSRARPVSVRLPQARTDANLSVSQGPNDPNRSRRCEKTRTEAVRGRVVRQRGVALKSALQRLSAVGGSPWADCRTSASRRRSCSRGRCHACAAPAPSGTPRHARGPWGAVCERVSLRETAERQEERLNFLSTRIHRTLLRTPTSGGDACTDAQQIDAASLCRWNYRRANCARRRLTFADCSLSVALVLGRIEPL